MKKILLLTLTFLVSFAAWAGDRTDEEMRAIALSQLVSPSVKGRFPSTFRVERLHAYNEMSVYGNEDGFVFISRDERIKPVLGYTEGTFDTLNMPEGLRWWIQKMDQCLADWRNMPDDVVAAYQESTLRLVEGYTAVPNFVKSKWDQGEPYNYYTPMCKTAYSGTKTEHASTGCVATAMAQILYYFQYPAQGQGEGSYTVFNLSGENIVSAGSKKVSVEGVYEYSKMKNVYGGATTTDQKEAIGTLMRDCGYSAQMSYNLDGYGSSGAHIFHAAAGMATNFSYDELAIRYYTRDYFTTEEWLKLVYDELTLKRPILYGGVQPPSSGHAFVLSGFNDKGLVFVNWGWSGSGNDYYDIALLNSPSGTFSAEQDMAFRFKTHPEADPDDTFESMWTFEESGWSAKLTSTQLRVQYDTHYNMHFLPFNGWIGVVFQNVETDALTLVDKIDTGVSNPLSGWSAGSSTYKFASDLSALPNGSYRLYIASLHVTEATPSPLRMMDQKGAVYYELTKTDATHYSLSEPKNFADVASEPTYRLVYMVDGKEYKSYYLKEGDPITPEPDPTKEHYEFSGWSEIPATMPAHEVVVTGSFTRSSAPVTLSGEGYATFYDSEVNYDVPSGVTACVVTDVKDGKLTCAPLSGVIPAGTAILLKGEKGAEITLTRHTGIVSPCPYTNMLYGSDVATTTSAPGSNLYYKLTYGQSGTYQAEAFGWYWGAANGAAFTIDGGKAWLAVPVSAAKERRFFRIDGDATGIDTLDTQADKGAAVFYDLQGRRVSVPAHGLFIRNGRKVFVK
ncbi:MAG: C10 family peptidase [Bacteroidales bacterium]|nr:C10 family peptidase [Bacteroidales bacterium]